MFVNKELAQTFGFQYASSQQFKYELIVVGEFLFPESMLEVLIQFAHQFLLGRFSLEREENHVTAR